MTLAVFWQVHSSEFVLWDDGLHVFENPYLHSLTWNNILAFWREPYAELYIPFTYTLWALTAAASRGVTALIQLVEAPLDPRFFHTLNLLVHLLNVLVVWRILRLLLGRIRCRKRSVRRMHPSLIRVEWAACGGALLFAMHPLQVEAVAWVTGLKDVLCGFLSYVAVWQYLSYISESVDATASRQTSPWQSASVPVALLAGPPGHSCLPYWPNPRLLSSLCWRGSWMSGAGRRPGAPGGLRCWHGLGSRRCGGSSRVRSSLRLPALLLRHYGPDH